MLALGYNEYGKSTSEGTLHVRLIVFSQLHRAEIGDTGYVSMIAFSLSQHVPSFQITRHMAAEYGGKHDKAWHTNMPA